MRTKGKLVVGGIALAAIAATIIIIVQGTNLERPTDIVQQGPSEQTAISIVETVTIIIVPSGQQVEKITPVKSTICRSLRQYQAAQK